MTSIPYDECAPTSAMIESMRAYGYTLSTAIADLIDNSISAGSRNVWLKFEWASNESWIAVTDDGEGMSETEIFNAMRLGSRSPLEERGPSDLGRFGLGMKTASFSQARRLTVISQPSSGPRAIRRWDLDHLNRPDVNGWHLLREPHEDSGDRTGELDKKGLETGTQVLLEVLDRIVGNSDTEESFVRGVDRVREHLEMVFHRFLADRGADKVRIYINDNPIVAWDPFVSDSPATQLIADDRFPVDETTEAFREVKLKSFVLPHKDRFDEGNPSRSNELHQQSGGPSGWNAHQGFYLYRNRRLIVAGDWLGLGPGRNGWKKEEHYKLARIRVDIPNSTDKEWQVDVKKSTAIAPPALASWLKGHAKTVRKRAMEVYAHRGSRKPRLDGGQDQHVNPWISRRHRGMISYRIDQRNPILKSLIDSLPADDQKRLETLLRLIEETVPVQQIWIDTAKNQDGVAAPFEGESTGKMREYILTVHAVLCGGGMDEVEAWNSMAAFEAFRGREALALIGILREESC